MDRLIGQEVAGTTFWGPAVGTAYMTRAWVMDGNIHKCDIHMIDARQVRTMRKKKDDR